MKSIKGFDDMWEETSWRKKYLAAAFFTDEKIPCDVGKLVCILAFFIQFFFLCKKILHMFIMTGD